MDQHGPKRGGGKITQELRELPVLGLSVVLGHLELAEPTNPIPVRDRSHRAAVEAPGI